MARMEPARLNCPACGKELELPCTVWGDTDSPKPLFHVAVDTQPVEDHAVACTGRTADPNEPPGGWGPNPDYKCFITDHANCPSGANGCTCSCHKEPAA